jgi:hypothetical protein
MFHKLCIGICSPDARIEIWYLGSFPGYDKEHGVAVMPNGKRFNKTEMLNVWAKPYINTCYGLSRKFQSVDVTPEELVLLKCICLLGTGQYNMCPGMRF